MKENKLRNVPFGMAFKEFGDKFISLNYMDNRAQDIDIIIITIDLKATDGIQKYGSYETRICLLTLEQLCPAENDGKRETVG